MKEHALAAVRYLGTLSAQELGRDDQTLSAIPWRVALVGEAAAQFSAQGTRAAAYLPLREARRMRDLIIHEYPEVAAHTVADTVRDDFPRLIADLERLLGRTP